MLPVDTSGLEGYYPWGRRIREGGNLPIGGLIPWQIYQGGHLEEFFPKVVDIRLEKFFLDDVEGQSHSYTVVGGNRVVGLLLREACNERIYIACQMTINLQNKHWYWPISRSRNINV